MPNFDFLNSDGSGQSQSPYQVGGRESRYPIWLWSIDLSPREYYLACLTDHALYVGPDYKSVGERLVDITGLNERQPEAVFKKSFTCIPLHMIRRLRFDDYYAWLDVVRIDGSIETIRDFETRQTKSMFDTLRRRLAPGAPIEKEPIRNERDVVRLAAVCLPIVFIALLFLSTALGSEEARRELKQTDFRVALVNAIGAATTIVLSVAAILAGAGFAVYKYRNPRKARSITVRR